VTGALEKTEIEPDARRRARVDRRLDVLAIAIVAFVFVLPLRGLLRTQGPPMEEGFMLTFPELVLKGFIPNRDFLHLYGPGSLWALAGVYKVFGVSLITERLFGLAQQLAIVFGIYALARQWGRTVAVAGAVTSAFLIIPFGLTALAWVGGVGLALVGLAFGVRNKTFTAGVLLGLAVLFRLDLVLAVTLAVLALFRGMARPQRRRLLIGLGVGIAPYLIQVATAGLGHSFKGMVLDPVFHLRGGRSLPIPPSWGHLDGFLQRAGALAQLNWPIPSLARPHQLFLFFFILLAVIGVLLFAAWRALRADRASPDARVLLVVALFSLGILPQALQRVDSAHFEWVGCVPFGFLPVALFDLTRRRWPNVKPVQLARAAGAATLALVIFVLPAFTVSTYADYALQTFDVHRTAYKISHDGRTFYYGKPDRAHAAQMVIDAAAKITKPGEKLFVGPVNLRKTPYSDAFLYYMLPNLDPGTYYIEMDPGVANASDSGLDKQLASSNIAILSAIWDNWSEPNDSRKVGSDKAEKVLAAHFCHVGTYLGLYQLWQRCR
jgi:hypothetical protein